MSALHSTTLFDVPLFSGTFAESFAQIVAHLKGSAKRTLLVFTPNTEQVMLAANNPAFLTALQQADLALPDGSGVVLAANLHTQGKKRIAGRIAGRDMMAALLAYAAQHTCSVFLLGGKDGVAEELKEKLKKKYPSLLVTSHPGALNISQEHRAEEKQVLQAIERVHPALLFVAYGAPWQELWLTRHAGELAHAGVKVAMVVGGSFAVLSGRLRACPKPVADLGLEWLWRLIQEPWRWRRQLVLVKFWAKVIGASRL